MLWTTRFTSRFPTISVPIMGAPMAGVSGGELAAETCRAGAMGFVAGGHLDNMEQLEKEIRLYRERTIDNKDFLAIGIISHSSMRNGNSERIEHVLKEYKPSVVQFFAPAVMKLNCSDAAIANNIDLAHKYGCHVMAQVGTVAEAQDAIEAGADTLIAQGGEAGGHGLRPDLSNGTFALCARIVSVTKVAFSNNNADKRPLVLAAGGIVDGRGLAAALALGCDGVVLGTRLWASQEALGHDEFKERLASPNAEPDQVIRTTVFDQIANKVSKDPWPVPYDSTGNLKNKTTDEWHGNEKELEAKLSQDLKMSADYKSAVAKGDPHVVAVYSGEGVGEIHSIDPAYDIIRRTSEEAMTIVQNISSFVVNDAATR